MPMIEADPNAEKVQKDRERKLVELSAALVSVSKDITDKQNFIENIDYVKNKHTAIFQLEELSKLNNKLLNIVERYETRRFGNVNLSRNTIRLVNLSSSLLDIAKKSKRLTDDIVDDVFVKMGANLQPIIETAMAKLGITPEGRLFQLKKRRESIENKRKEIESRPILSRAKVRNFGALASMADISGKSILDLVNERHAELEVLENQDKNLKDEENRLKNQSLQEAIADNDINKVSQVIRGESLELISTIKNSGLGSTKSYEIIRGSVIVTGQLNPQRFRAAGFQVFQIGSQFILMDQYILAIYKRTKEEEQKYQNKITKEIVVRNAVKDKKKSEIKSKKRQHPQGLGETLTTYDVLNILKARGENYIDVAGLSLNRTPYEIYHPEISNVKFIWLMRVGDFHKASQGTEIKIRGIELPSQARKSSGNELQEKQKQARIANEKNREKKEKEQLKQKRLDREEKDKKEKEKAERLGLVFKPKKYEPKFTDNRRNILRKPKDRKFYPFNRKS